MFQEFKEFAAKGNVLDMAVGVIMGASFGKIVTTFTDGILMPPIGMILGGIDFNDKFFSLDGKVYATIDAAKKAGAPIITYGALINSVIDFLIVAFVLFLLVKQVNRLKSAPPPAPPPPKPVATPEQKLLTEIRDLLAKK
ncbi:MAG TPA: large conductance mechanosensitive channel protein MscL [Bryobacteraceae bacterium]|jgi:large conductance mechanosensitive channel